MDLHQEHEALLRKSLERYQRRFPHDPDLQRSAPDPVALDELASGGRSSIETLALACSLYADRPAFGERAFEVTDEGALRRLPHFHTSSYAEVWSRIQAFASGLHHGGLAEPGDRIAISGFASVDWLVADFACLYLAAVSVPLQTGMPAADLEQILHEAAPRTIVCSAAQLDATAESLSCCPEVRGVVVMDRGRLDRAEQDALAARIEALQAEQGARVVVTTMDEVARIGRQQGLVPYAIPAEARDGEADPLMTILYTSGSTGTPKGAMFPESVVRAQWQAPGTMLVPHVAHVGVCYMPLNHAAGRFEVQHGMQTGGVTYFVLASDMSTLFEDIRIARPTRLMLVPRVSSMIHQHYQAELVRRRAEADIVAEMRRGYLGDRLVYAIVGTAPTAPEVVAFLERCFEMPVFDGYGSTEAGMISFDGKIARDEVIAFKLFDVPELGYRTSDEPHPRGELCVKTRRHVPGYYKNEAATKELFDAEGWLHTGDIVELRAGDEIRWLDRKKNVLKLAQGEFVSTSRLEALYAAKSPFIAQVYVHGSSLRSYLLAVVVPQAGAAQARLGDEAEEADIKRLLRDEIERVAREEGLPRWEVPREILIEPSPFTRENGLLTASNKPSRPKLAARYGALLEQIYAEIERTQLEKLTALEGEDSEASVVQQVALAVEITLGLSEIDERQGFVQLGGDSLAAVRLSSILEERFGVAVPVGLVLDPTSSVQTLAAYVEDRLAGAARAVSFEAVHGAGATVVRADDLRLDRLLTLGDLDAALRADPVAPAVRRVFLTGASGFLGRFLLLDLLERLPAGGNVVCVVRAPGDAEALARLEAVFQTDPALSQRFAELAGGGRLTALAGDLMKPRFGLSEAEFDRIAGEVDAVVHNGALVNHAFSYRDLFEPNVLGTAEAIRLALRRRLKSMVYVSTIGVAGGLDREEPVREDEDARSLWRERPIDSGYAVGYATSKWAGELLVRELAERFGVPAAVCRCSMIMPHRRWAGQVNAGDFLTRLLASVVLTGVAPRSFYAGFGAHHFDGSPVDVVAGSIAAIAADPRSGLSTYHVVNPHWDDGVSLDTMVDWIQSAGYPITRVDDHARWFEAFDARLEALPATQKQRSALPIVKQWARPASGELRFDAARLRERLRAEMPHLTERYLHKYLRDMVAARLIGPPGGKLESAA